MVHYQNDYEFGKKEENSVLPIISNFFNREIKQTEKQYDPYDFYDDNYIYEMKSRKNTYSRYPTTIITTNKFNKDKKQILLFNFTDGLYYIEYDTEKFSKYEKQMFSRAGFKWDEKEHIYIPIADLQLISKK